MVWLASAQSRRRVSFASRSNCVPGLTAGDMLGSTVTPPASGGLARRWTLVRTLVAIGLFSLAVPQAMAKCTSPTVVVSGTVTDRQGSPIPNAAVAVAWIRRGEPQGPAQGLADSTGSFRVQFLFHTSTSHSMLRGDVCKERLPHVSVSAYTPGHRSESMLVSVLDWAAYVDLKVDPYRE